MDEDELSYIGPFGCLRPIACLPPQIEAPSPRPSSRGVTIWGVPFTQQAPRRASTYTLELGPATPELIRELVALEHGSYGPPPWRWYNPYAATLNMLPQGAAVPGSLYELENLGGSVINDSPPTMFDPDLCLAYSVQVAGNAVTGIAVTGGAFAPAREGLPDPVPVIPGRTYTFTANGQAVTGSGWFTRLSWVNAAGEVISDSDGSVIPASALVATRGEVSAAAPTGAAGVLVGVHSVDDDGLVDSVTALQLTETAEPVTWYSGVGMPRISIPGGLEGALVALRQLCDIGDDMHTVSIVLVEVGI